MNEKGGQYSALVRKQEGTENKARCNRGSNNDGGFGDDFCQIVIKDGFSHTLFATPTIHAETGFKG